MPLRFVSADEIDTLLQFEPLIAALDDAFRAEITVPVRAHHAMVRPGASEATLLLMPAWTAASGGFLGTKIVSVFPDNARQNKPTIVGVYILFDGDSGEPLAVMDGPRLTLWRTAAASALASRYLSRADAHCLTMVGAGALAPFLIRAHASVRPITEVRVWNRSPKAAEALVAAMRGEGVAIRHSDDIEAATRSADIISCSTMSATPLVKGAWLKDGSHLDLVGAYRPSMRESDDDAVKRAHLYCDTRAGAMKEGGDLADPLARGIIMAGDIRGDLAELTRGQAKGREREGDITLFKSVGTAIEDLAAAMLVWRLLAR